MRNLFSVGLFRTVRSKLFYILLALTALVMAYVYYNTYRLQLGPDFSQLDLYFFQFINANIVSAAVFCPLFLSSEYGDGALRNKLMVGRTRPQIYLANLAVNCLYGTAACLAAVVTGLCVGVPLLGWFQNAGPEKILLYVLLALATTWVCAALYTFLSMVVASRGVAITLCILLAFGLILLGQYLYLALSQEEVLTALFYTDTGEMAVSEQPNPAYLTGFCPAGVPVLLRADPRRAGLPDFGHERPVPPADAGVFRAGVRPGYRPGPGNFPEKRRKVRRRRYGELTVR